MPKRVRAARHYQRADDATRRLADAAHVSVRHELRSAFANLKAVVPVKAVAEAIKAGNDPRKVIPFDHFREVLRSGFTKLVALYLEAGQLGARKINGRFHQAGRRLRYRKAGATFEERFILKAGPRERAQYQFDSLSPDTLASLRDTQDALIVQLESDARDTIETAIADGIANGLSADDIAENIRDVISLTESQAQAVLNYQSALYNLDPSALDRQLRNSDYDASVQDAIDSGEFLSEAAVQNMVDDYISNYLDYRSDTIARTESVRAANQGLHDSYSQAVDRGVFPAEAVTRTWQLADRPCPICESIPDNNPDGVGVDEDFQSDDGPVSDPPVHPNCMCSVEYVTDLSMVSNDDTEDEEATA